jgi:hypothetical protein
LISRLKPAEHGQNNSIVNLIFKKSAAFSDISFGGQKNKGISRIFYEKVMYGSGAMIQYGVSFFSYFRRQGGVAQFNRIGSALYCQNGAVVEVISKRFCVDGGGSDYELQICSSCEQLLEITQEKINIQTAFMGFIDDNNIIFFQIRILPGFREKDTVGHEFYPG